MSKVQEKMVILPESLHQLLRSPVTWIVSATILCLLSYSNSFHGELVHDDIFAIRDNADIRPPTPLAQLFRNDFWGEPMSSETSHKSYRPLTVLTFRLNYLLHGLEPMGYHVINVGLHIVATLLLGWVCKCVLCGGVEVAFLTMCLFAVHPVHTEAVTGIVGRADVLACIFFFLSLLFYWSSVTSTHQSVSLRAAKFTGSLLAGAAAMLSKEHGATVLGVCLVYHVLVISRRTLVDCLTKKTLLTSKLRPLTLYSISLTLTAGVLFLVRVWLLNGKLPAFSRQDNPASFADSLLTRALSYSNLLYFNARLLVYPAVLCFDYQMGSIALVESLADPRNVTTAIFYFVLICLTWRGLQETLKCRHGNSHVTIMGLLLVVVPFLPASNLFIRVGFVVAERILYIPSAGYCILVTHGAVVLTRRFKTLRPIISLLFLLLLCSFTARTIARNPVWSTRESLFRSGLRTIPHNAKIHFNFANFLKDSGRTEEAIQHYRTAVSLWPEHAVSHNNLGTLLTNLTEAETHYRAAVHHKPGHYRALFNLGSNLVKQGRLDEAESSFRRSLTVNPSYTDSLVGLASLLAYQGRSEEGRGYMEQAAAIVPGNADVLSSMGTHLLRMERGDEAMDVFQQALKIDPAHFSAMVGLAQSHRSRRENSEAETWFKRALTIKEDSSTLHLLGAFYHNTGSLDKAAVSFQRALSLDPSRTDTVCSCSQTLLQLSRHGDVIKLADGALRDHAPSECLHSVLANAHLQRGELKEAEYHSSLAVDLAIDDFSRVEALRLYGGVLKDVGKLEQAELVYRKAVQLAPGNPTTHLNLGALLHLLRNYPGAREQYERTLELDPSNSLARENLKRLARLERKAAP